MENKNEIWKAVVGFEGVYEVSSFGHVRSLDRVNGAGMRLKGRKLAPGFISGYPFVNLHDDVRYPGEQKVRRVHRLVLEAFVGPRPDGMECRHLDGEPANNRLENLAWGTKEEQEADKRKHGSSSVTTLEDMPLAQIEEARDLYTSGWTMAQIARDKKWPSKQLVAKAVSGLKRVGPIGDGAKILAAFDKIAACGGWEGLAAFSAAHGFDMAGTSRILRKFRPEVYARAKVGAVAAPTRISRRKYQNLKQVMLNFTESEFVELTQYMLRIGATKLGTTIRETVLQFIRGEKCQSQQSLSQSESTMVKIAPCESGGYPFL